MRVYMYLRLNFREIAYFKDDKYRKREALYTLITSPVLYLLNILDIDLNVKEYQLGKHFKSLKNASAHESMYTSYLKRMKG